MLWPDFATNFPMKYGTFMAVVVSGLVVDVDDLEGPQGGVVECDAEGPTFFNFFDVFPGDRVEVFEESFANESGDSSSVSVSVAPENREVFRGNPCGLVAFCGVCFLDTDNV